MERISNIGASIIQAITNDPRRVSWAEIEKRQGVEYIKIVNAPFRVQAILNSTLFDEYNDFRTICLSATLSATGKAEKKKITRPDGSFDLVQGPLFEQFMQKVGIQEALEFQCPSPFDYQNNCGLYLGCSAITEEQNTNSQEYKAWFRQHCFDLIQLSQGNALVLTTSTKAAKETAEFLAQMLPGDIPVRGQGPTYSNSQLVEWFKTTPRSVLVGTASFWEGISIEGEQLKLVIIDKIPFPSHMDPLQRARDAWYKSSSDKQKRSFMDLSLYPAIIRLKQGFGRLIRTKTDRGVVAILDPRLTLARYKGLILNALPPAALIKRIDDPKLLELLS